MTTSFLDDPPFDFPEEQRPLFPGSPARPPHPRGRRYAYGAIGVLLGITAGLGNTLVQGNAIVLQGGLGADVDEVAWISTAYAMTYVGLNIIMVRVRQQFGLRRYAIVGLSAFCLLTASHLVVRGVGGAITIHALAGIAASPLISLSVYYLISAMPPPHGLRGAVLGFGVTQLPFPIARLMGVDTLALDQWSALYQFELGFALVCLAAVILVRLPPTEKRPAFEWLDAISYPLIAGGFALVVAVLGLGRYEWWLDRDWLGWVLAASIPLLAAGLYIEWHRANPLIDLRWLAEQRLFRFAFVVVALRIVLSEQTTLIWSFLNQQGLLNTDLSSLAAVILVGGIAGTIIGALVFEPPRLLPMVCICFVIIAIAAWIDSGSTILTRAPQLYATQAAIAFAASFGVGTSMVFGLMRAKGGNQLTTFLVVLSSSLTVGSLIGSASLSTLQVVREKANSVALVERASSLDPGVQARIASGGANATAALQAAMTRQANVLAFDNCFAFVAALAAVAALYVAIRIATQRLFPVSTSGTLQ